MARWDQVVRVNRDIEERFNLSAAVRSNGTLFLSGLTSIDDDMQVIGAGDITRVELCRSNEFIYAKPVQGREAAFTYRDLKPVTGRSYYYVRVQQNDAELAWSSPVWVTTK